MTKLEKRLTAAVAVLAIVILILVIVLGSVVEGQNWYTEQISSLQSENAVLRKNSD
ncbi:MAG: hypothetical protein FWE80_04050 [Oscillospiraceae bacterium]|nr:hypothetical protein [Oscillospiraceae bacterium]